MPSSSPDLPRPSISRRVFRYFRPLLRPTVAGLGLTFVTTLISLLQPWPFKIIIDELLPGSAHFQAGAFTHTIAPWLGGPWDVRSNVLLLAGLLIAFHLVNGLLGLATAYLYIKVGLRALLQLRTDLFTTLNNLSLKFHDARRSADSSFRVAYDSQSLQTFYNKGFTNVFASGFMLVSTFAIMWSLDWVLTLLSLGVVPFVMWALKHYAGRIREESTAIQESESAVLQTVQEGMSSIRVVQAFGRERETVDGFFRQALASLRANLRLNFTNMWSSLMVSSLMAAGTAMLIYFGTLHVLDGTLTLGTLTVFVSYLAMLYTPIQNLTGVAWALEGAAAGAQRCFEILDAADDVRDAPGAVPLVAARGDIGFEGVAFHYASERKIISDVSLQIRAGESVAFVGGTGAGKSTLLSLVPRFYDPTEGRVLIDGLDLRALTKRSVRDNISIVLQETVLFSTTVRENIAYGRPGATDAEIEEAARRAQAWDFVMAMPGGFDASVGERGGHLSGGQRPRIGIARAFLTTAPILLLDEPTSALDPATEAGIMETLAGLMRGRTTLIITHRLATVHHLDKIVVLEAGRVVEVGRGPELVTRAGAYAKLYRAGNFGAAPAANG